jgi:hypothetical protein
MNVFPNQNNVYLNGTLISGASALTTGTPVKIDGFGRLSIVIEGINNPSFTGIIQAIVHPSQTNWVNIFSTGITSNNAAMFQTAGQFDSLRVIVNPYVTGTCNVWINGSQT